MWLRDFLSKDLPQCRTMIYGYNSKLSSHGVDTILDYGRELMEEMKQIRDTKEVSDAIKIFYWQLFLAKFSSSRSRDLSSSSHTALEASSWLTWDHHLIFRIMFS